MPRIELTWSDLTHGHYRVFDDDGRELRQVHRDISSEIAEAKRRHISLTSMLARSEGFSQPALAATPDLDAGANEQAEIPPHIHDGLVLELERTWAEIAALGARIPELYAEPEHSHSGTEAAMSELAAALQVERGHGHTDLAKAGHDHEHEHFDLEARLSRLDAFAAAEAIHQHEGLAARMFRMEEHLALEIAAIGVELGEIKNKLATEARQIRSDLDKKIGEVATEVDDALAAAIMEQDRHGSRINALEDFRAAQDEHAHPHGHPEIEIAEEAVAALARQLALSEVHTHDGARWIKLEEDLGLIRERVQALGETVQVEHQHAWILSSEEDSGGFHWTIEQCWECGRIQKHGRRL